MENNNKPILSLLICTIEGREHFLKSLLEDVKKQMEFFGIDSSKIAIVISKDKKGQNTIGKKRNLLLSLSKGLYSMFIDDDDMFVWGTLPLIINVLQNEKPDVLELEGIITFDGINPKTFIHSLNYTEWFEKDNIYYRPPNHLNPIKTDIAKQFLFPEINHGEDREWSMAICRAGVLKKQSSIYKPYYKYQYISNK